MRAGWCRDRLPGVGSLFASAIGLGGSQRLVRADLRRSLLVYCPGRLPAPQPRFKICHCNLLPL
jgi:hypothetical protein